MRVLNMYVYTCIPSGGLPAATSAVLVCLKYSANDNNNIAIQDYEMQHYCPPDHVKNLS